MKKLCLALALTILCLAFTGCATKETGSREYKPGQGWVPT
jgi:hypothetical protein